MTADLAGRIRSALNNMERVARDAPVDPLGALVAGLDFAAASAHKEGEPEAAALKWAAERLAEDVRRIRDRVLHDPAAVLRRVAAERRVLARHRPVDCHCGTDWHTHRCRGCDRPWPCDEIRDQADRMGINTEETP